MGSRYFLNILIGAVYFGFTLLCVNIHLWANGWPMQVVVRELQPLYIADMLGVLFALYGLLFRS